MSNQLLVQISQQLSDLIAVESANGRAQALVAAAKATARTRARPSSPPSSPPAPDISRPPSRCSTDDDLGQSLGPDLVLHLSGSTTEGRLFEAQRRCCFVEAPMFGSGYRVSQLSEIERQSQLATPGLAASNVCPASLLAQFVPPDRVGAARWRAGVRPARSIWGRRLLEPRGRLAWAISLN